MRNARLDELQTEIKIGETNITNLRYEDGTILMAEREEELKSLLMKVKEEREKHEHKLLDTSKKKPCLLTGNFFSHFHLSQWKIYRLFLYRNTRM